MYETRRVRFDEQRRTYVGIPDVSGTGENPAMTAPEAQNSGYCFYTSLDMFDHGAGLYTVARITDGQPGYSVEDTARVLGDALIIAGKLNVAAGVNPAEAAEIVARWKALQEAAAGGEGS
ncbi:Uncharacterised protein [Mycobacteroides abscessus subsp. abscessus]|uniref:hypothetical protein n=1 Tax=Mycobacteroides abscessus TaxID=36809 RepID=UPI000929A41E|nr:hypothetical protein [Mycobacteroides abscessus]SIJ21175.1 Uncharacterised protein [Mycobacteroides abscessus subsp. abscessus]SLH39305.1 Uncharacterised protein [Mycobacteroides abscessus subsp. abscessus]